MMQYSSLAKMTGDIARMLDNELLRQLKEFTDRGLIIIERSEMILVQDQFSDELSVQQKVRLVLKDQQYVESLETKVADLELRLETITNAIKGHT